MTSDADANARAYLLGELSDDGEAAIEQALLIDPNLLDLLHQVEHDLVDDYIAGSLATADRDRFERHYLASAPHRNRVAVARALFDHRRAEVSSAPSTAVADGGAPFRAAAGSADRSFARLARTLGMGSRTLGWATAVALLAIAVPLVLARWRNAPENRVEPPAIATASPQTPAAPASSVDPARPTTPTDAPLHVSLALPAISTRSRGETTPRVTVTSAVAVIDLLLGRGGSTLAPAQAEVRSVDDRVVWTGESAAPSSATAEYVAVVSVPADRVPPDDYIVTLTDRSGGVLFRSFFRVVQE